MRVVVISSYPPRHCGIGVYARAQVDRLRADGHDVVVISPPDGDGDIRVPFGRGRQFREAIRVGREADRIVVHFQPGVHYLPGAKAAMSKVRTSLALRSLIRRRPQVEILVHESTPRPARWRLDLMILARVFATAQLSFHTDAERRALEREYRVRVHSRLVDHRDGVDASRNVTRDDARRRLGLDPRGPLFLCAGFLHPWKGFERAIRAFETAGSPGRLAMVGSVRDPTPENLAYADGLRSLTETVAGVTLVEDFVDDETFDLWIVAADRLVLPYRRAWSSGALARARVLRTPAIVSAIGGLTEQVGEEDELFDSDAELVTLFQRFGSVNGDHPAERPHDPPRAVDG
jgi:glycosyltransferase involved in cell wall biosynthesis